MKRRIVRIDNRDTIKRTQSQIMKVYMVIKGLEGITFAFGKELKATDILEFWEKNDTTISPTDNKEEIENTAKIHPDLFIIAMNEKSEIVGTVWGTFDGRRGYIVHLAVRRDCRKRGFGNLLMKKVEKTFEKYGIHKAHILIEKSNSKVVDFYKKLGYNERDDILLMSKRFRN